MKYFSKTCILGAMAALLWAPDSLAAPQRIAVEDEAPEIYCVSSLSGNRGVYKISSEGSFSEEKISGTTYIQWSFAGSGGTFLSTEKAVGTTYSYSLYAVIATAEGGGDGPWSHTFYNYRDPQTYVNYPKTLQANDMAYDQTTDKVYGWFTAGEYSVGEYNLAIYDYNAKSKTVIGSTSQTKIVALACDKEGQLWGIADNGTLYAIDKTSGALTSKGSLGVTCYEQNQSAAIDHASGKMYWTTAGSYSAALYVVDINACTATKIYDFPTGKRFNGFYIAPPEANPAAPAAPENLTATFNGTNVDIAFTAPTKSFGGDALSGNLTYTINNDGDLLASASIKPGEQFSNAYTLVNGMHQIEVFVSNIEGDSPVARTSVFAGYDAPAALAKPSIEADGNQITISWAQPEGANGGAINPALVSYNVVRNPGNVEVATGIKATSVTDVIPVGMISDYTYTVTLIYDGEESSNATTDAITVGKPYQIPYLQTFNSLTSIDEEGCKTINASKNPDMGWKLAEKDGNKFVEFAADGTTEANNYFFTAPIEFNAETTYTLSFKVSNNSTQYSANLRIGLAKTQTTNVYDHLYPYIYTNLNYRPTEEQIGVFTDFSKEFTVPESGVYSICFLDKGYSWYNNTIALDDILINDPTTVGVGSMATDAAAAISVANGQLRVSADAQNIAVFTTDGRKIASACGNLDIRAPRGIYIVTVGAKATKVVL